MEKMKDLDTICTMKERLVEALHGHIAQGIEHMDAKESGEVADMIKDLAEAEKSCYEACYYKHVIKAMEEKDDTVMPGIAMTPKLAGYKPYVDQMPYVNAYLNDPAFRENMRMGYPMDGNVPAMTADPRYGKAYNAYRSARRFFTETHAERDRDEMNAHANEHISDTIATMRDIWKSADPDMKRRIREDFSNLIGEMVI